MIDYIKDAEYYINEDVKQSIMDHNLTLSDELWSLYYVCKKIMYYAKHNMIYEAEDLDRLI